MLAGSPTTSTGSAATWCARSTRRGCSTASSTRTFRGGRTIPPRSRSRGARSCRSWAPSRPPRARRSAATSFASSTTAPENPVSIVSSTTAAREGARTLQTILTEMWESVNTFDLQLARRDLDDGLRTGPYSIYSLVKERSALFWGLTARTMQKDDARAFLVAGGRLEAADMVLRMLRVALPPAPEGDGPEAPRRDGNALALLRAVGGFQAFMRAAAAPPNAGPVSRFMLFEREFPDSVASSIDRWRPRLSGWKRSRRSPRRCCASGGCLPTSTSGHVCRRTAAPSRRCSGRSSRSLSGSTPRSTNASSIQAPW